MTQRDQLDATPPSSFDCRECGKHVGDLGRTASPMHVERPGEEPAFWSFCSGACWAAHQARHPDMT